MIINTSGSYTVQEGDIIRNGKKDYYQIIKIDGEKVWIKYLDDYQYEDCIYFYNIKNKMIHNPYNKNIYGVACIGIVPAGYSITKEYLLWNDIIIKCYNTKSVQYQNYGAKGIKVANDWLCFEKFLYDLPSIYGYNNWINDTNNYYLNKDIYYGKICKLYSNRTCIFTNKNVIGKQMCYIIKEQAN